MTTTYVLWPYNKIGNSEIYSESRTPRENGKRVYVCPDGVRIELDDAHDVVVHNIGIEIDTYDERFPNEEGLSGTAYKIVAHAGGDEGYLMVEGSGTFNLDGRIISSTDFELLKIESDYVRRTQKWMV